MPSLASGLQRCSPWETFGITTAASLLGFLSMCVPLQQRKPADGIEKAYNTGYSGNTAGCEHGFWRDAAIFHYVDRWLPWPPSKGQTSARSLLVHFARGQPNDVALQRSTLFWRHCWRIMGFQRRCWANSFTLCPRACWQQTCKAHSKVFLDDGHLPRPRCLSPGSHLRCVFPGYFQRSGSLCQIRSGTESMQRRRWVSMDLASAQLDCLLHALGAAVSKTCSQTIQFPPCFGIAVFRSLV